MHKDSVINSANAPDVLYEIYDDYICACGEGPLWHPARQQLYWVDVTHHKILTQKDGVTEETPFGEFVTALAWIDDDHLLAATETSLTVLNLSTFEKEQLSPLEADDQATRSNDGRVDPWGGFWVSTMGKDAEEGRGKIYRYYDGRLSIVIPSITIPNAICFDKPRRRAYFADTKTQKLFTLNLNCETGAPEGLPSLFKDFSYDNQAIDGAVIDVDGNLWIGVWDGKNILKISPEGVILERYPTGADRPTCPAFGGPNHTDLYVTTAAIGLEDSFENVPEQGKTLVFKGLVKGIPAPRFIPPKHFKCVS